MKPDARPSEEGDLHVLGLHLSSELLSTAGRSPSMGKSLERGRELLRHAQLLRCSTTR